MPLDNFIDTPEKRRNPTQQALEEVAQIEAEIITGADPEAQFLQGAQLLAVIQHIESSRFNSRNTETMHADKIKLFSNIAKTALKIQGHEIAKTWLSRKTSERNQGERPATLQVLKESPQDTTLADLAIDGQEVTLWATSVWIIRVMQDRPSLDQEPLLRMILNVNPNKEISQEERRVWLRAVAQILKLRNSRNEPVFQEYGQLSSGRSLTRVSDCAVELKSIHQDKYKAL
jgi:hypothetical protein